MNKRLVLCVSLISLGTAWSFSAETRTNPPAIQSRVQQEGALARENVNDEQRAKLREANEKFRTEQSGLYEKLRVARRELEQTAQADTSNEKAIREKASVLGQIEGDLAILRAKHYKELRTILPHDQAARQSGLSAGTNVISGVQSARPAPATNNVVTPRSTPKK